MPRPLRIFHLIKSLGRGGAEMLLVDGPGRSDPAQFVFGFGYFLPHKDALVPALRQRFGHVVCFDAGSGGRMLTRVARVAHHLRDWRADILHCHLPLAGIVGRIAGVAAGVPVVYTEHNKVDRYHPATRFAARATWRWQSRVIAVSADVAVSLERHVHGTIPVTVIRNGVSLDTFTRTAATRDAARARLALEDGQPFIGCVAVFREQKRLDLWLDVAVQVAATHPQARFVLVGDGPLRETLRMRVGQMGLADRVLLPGLISDVREYLAAMDVYLMSSDFEGLPVALLEAMAMEVPPVATAVGGIPEVVETGRSGVLVARNDVAGLTTAVNALVDGPAEARLRMGQAARARVAGHFSTDRMMRAIEQVYRDVLT